MYPFNFKPEDNFIDFRKIFVVMPFAEEYKSIYTDLIIPAIDNINKKFDEKNRLYYSRADDPNNTRSGWLEILENIFPAVVKKLGLYLHTLLNKLKDNCFLQKKNMNQDSI